MFIRWQVEPEIKDDENNLYGHSRYVFCYKPGFSGHELIIDNPAAENGYILDSDGGRVNLIGA